MATLNDVRAANWAISLDNPREIVQGIDEITQCILLILATQKGSDPFRPEFGCDILPHIDLPILQARANITKEILRAIEIWEPRVTITAITSTLTDISHLTFSVVWTIPGTDIENTIDFPVNLVA